MPCQEQKLFFQPGLVQAVMAVPIVKPWSITVIKEVGKVECTAERWFFVLDMEYQEALWKLKKCDHEEKEDSEEN